MDQVTCVVRRAALLAGLMVAPAAAQTSLSIYSDGRVVVRQTIPQALKKGRNQLIVAIPGLDASSVFSPDTGVAIVSATVLSPTSRDQALQQSVGKTLAFVSGRGDTVHATVVRVAPPQYRLADGRFLLVDPGQRNEDSYQQPPSVILGEPLFPPDLVRTSSQASLDLNVSQARPATRLAFVTTGIAWSANYQVVLQGARALVAGTATVTSQDMTIDSAEVQLVAGTVQRAANNSVRLQAVTVEASPRAERALYAPQQAVGELHVYDLPGRLVIRPDISVVTALFPRSTTDVVREFIVPGVLPLRGWLSQASGDPDEVPVQVWYTLKRARGTAFADHPLPGGTIQVFEADSSGRVQLIGEASTDHTPAAKDLRFQAADAFDVTAERVQTDYNQEQIPPVKRGMPSRQRVTASYRVTLTNAKPDSVTVDVRETHFGTWQITDSSVPAEKLSSTESRFRVKVPAGGTATLTYTVQVES